MYNIKEFSIWSEDIPYAIIYAMVANRKNIINNYAFIDSQNLNLAIRDQGWKLDFAKFKQYLSVKYSVSKCFLFIGYVPDNQRMYTQLQKLGYVIIFKPTLMQKGIIKGNCDAELVLHAMIEYSNYERAVVVTGDGDFFCLVDYLQSQSKLEALLIPNQKVYSSLLKKIGNEKLKFMNNLKKKLEYKQKEKALV